MRNITGYIAALALTACASSGPNDPRTDEDRVILSDSDVGTIVDVSIRREDYIAGGLVEAPRETVWSLLPLAYEDVGLPPPAFDESTWTMAVQNHMTMRQVGKERMSRLLNCGSEIMGPVADTHRIRLSVRTWLEPYGVGTNVMTRVEASATSVEGRAGTATCTSTGELEKRITEAVRTRAEG